MQDDSSGDRFKTGGALEAFSGATANLEAQLIGRELGGYRVNRLIAEGGMSRIFAAERIDGSFEREVAIKVSPVSGLDERMRERFSIEQGVLASLNHTNISQLYDAAVTEEGWPYIVMELIDGQPLTDHADAKDLSVEQCVELLVRVVDAIAYAHSRLIVHRDIKPSNVLVDASGNVKVLDFGIAKLLEEDATQATREQAMTPRYASPEQLLGKPVSIASDIYQLGLLLAEVLTGRPASDGATLGDAIQRAAQGKSLSLDAGQRDDIPRELALIVEQCLRHDPDERFRDANALREDLEAYLEGYPVAAAGQGRVYRLRKFVYRNLPATAIATIAVLSVAGSTIWYTASVTEQRDEAERQTQLAQESLDFLAGMFDAANPDNAQGRELSAIDVLDLGAERIESELADQPEIQERLYFTLGRTYWRLGELEKASAAADRLVEVNEALYGDAFEPQIEALNFFANIKGMQGDLETSRRLFEDLAARTQNALGPDHPKTLKVKNNLAVGYWVTGKLEEARTIYEDVFSRKSSTIGRRDQSTLATAVNLVNIYSALGDQEKAVEIGEQNLEISEESLGEGHITTMKLLRNTAGALLEWKGPDEALPLFEEAVRRMEGVLGPEHIETARAKARLAGIYVDSGDFERGEPMEREAVETMIRLRGVEHPDVLSGRANYLTTLGLMGRYDEVLAQIPAIVELQEAYRGPTHIDTLYARIVLADALVSTGDEDGESYARSVAEKIVDTYGVEHWLYEAITPVLQKL